MKEFIVITFIIGFLTAVLFPCKQKKAKVSADKVAIILGDKSGKHNAINIAVNKSKLHVDKPLTMVKIKEDGALSKPEKISKKLLLKNFGDVIAATPPEMYATNIFFKKGVFLSSGEKEHLKKIAEEIKKRAPCEIDIIGHSDRKGLRKKNLLISKKRALFVKKLLEQMDVDIKAIHLSYVGEEGTLVNTKDAVAEPKNRRVEIKIR